MGAHHKKPTYFILKKENSDEKAERVEFTRLLADKQ